MKGLPILTTIFQIRVKILQEMLSYLKREKPKGFVYFWQGAKIFAMAIDPDSAKFLLKSPDIVKYDGLTNIPKYVTDNFGISVLTTNGDIWKRHRSYVNSGFTTNAVSEYFPIFSSVTEKALLKMGVKDQKDVDVQSLFSKFTLDLLGKSIFHYDFGRLDDKSTESYNSYRTLIARPNSILGILMYIFPWLEKLPIPQILEYYRSADQLKNFFLQIIKERKESGKKYFDILDNLLSSTQEGLSQVELLSNIFIFFLAGHETTATTLTWECVCLAKYQDIQEKLYQEIQENIGNRLPTFDDLTKLEKLDCFIHEVMRVNPSSNFVTTRMATKDVVYKDQVIPKGTTVSYFVNAVNTHPDFWDQPEKFDPDRFLPENKKGRNHYAFLTFSVGPRQCIGSTFSIFEQRLMLVRLLQNFRVLPPKNSPLRDGSQLIPFGKYEPVNIHFQLRSRAC